LVTDYWSGFTNVGPGASGDSLWFSDRVGLVRRKSYSGYGNNTKSFGSLSVELDGNPTLSIGKPAVLPVAGTLHQNYPNPFNPTTTIKFELPKASQVNLSVYDLLGRQVSVLVNEKKDAGVHEVKFDASGLSSGVYFYRIQVGDFTQTRKLCLIR
jgi:hypothetical protein